MATFPIRRRAAWILVGGAVAAMVAAACGGGGTAALQSSPATSSPGSTPTQTAASPGQSAVPPEKNPPGDIPDNTVFVPYTSAAGGFTIKVPEGWARSTTSSSVSFTSTLNSVSVAWKSASSAPTVSSAKAVDVPALRASELAFSLQSVSSVSLPGGTAIEIVFQENSQPNQVTGKQYRLVVERFAFYKNGTEADLSLASPVGADNVDPWRTVSESFRWT
jgi:hypothetical protein